MTSSPSPIPINSGRDSEAGGGASTTTTTTTGPGTTAAVGSGSTIHAFPEVPTGGGTDGGMCLLSVPSAAPSAPSTTAPAPAAPLPLQHPILSNLSTSRPLTPTLTLSHSQTNHTTPTSTRPTTPIGSSSLLSERPPPVLLNELTSGDGESILVLVVEEEKEESLVAKGGGRELGGGRVYGGSQGGDIHVWNLKTLALRARLSGHEGAVLALQLVPERDWLISSSGDGTIRIWHTPSLSPLYIIHPPHDNVGDIFSLAWIDSDLLVGSKPASSENLRAKGRGRLYAGCQDTSILSIDLPPAFHLDKPHDPLHLISESFSSRNCSSPPIHRAPNKFFDSLSLADRPRSRLERDLNSRSASSTSLVNLALGSEDSTGTGGTGSGGLSGREEHVVELQFEEDKIAHYAHYGYVYCLLVGKSNEKSVLISASGDERIKLWRMTHSCLTHLATLENTNLVDDAVLAIAVRDNTLFAGHQEGAINVWDLDTFTCVRTLRPHSHDILTLTVEGDDLYSGSENGKIQRWDKSFNLVAEWHAHDDIVLASTPSKSHLLTGGSDARVKIWDVLETDVLPTEASKSSFQGDMFHALRKLVSFRTVADEDHREECRQGALYLKRILRQLGAETVLLPGAPERNPLVVATFKANKPDTPPHQNGKRRRRVLCYGHYDVVAASDINKWSHDPFDMTGKNGWIYGRGVSDNKGPILAIAAAASELRKAQMLDVDLVMVVEGEEETGSAGFQDAIRKNRSLIGDIDVILVSNSYWIGEDIPCLTFGLRGVIHATVTIKSNQPDLHSGMQGGVVSEPLVDMVRLLASLTDADGRVQIPHFLGDVRELGKEENALYDAVIERCKGGNKLYKNSHIADPRQSLITRWRQPALSIHKVDVVGPQKTLIPSCATSSLSIRIVPDQSLLAIVEQLKAHLAQAFGSIRTHNVLSVDIDHVADWWLGDVDSVYFKAFADCIESEWDVKPLLIREGGSIPSLPFLEREFQADAVHFPMGTSSDAAHLPDERIRVINLERGKNIVSKWLTALSGL